MLTISLEREDYDALASLAEQRSESFAAVVRAAVHSYIRRQRRR
jgi:predicted transcriptional regulator